MTVKGDVLQLHRDARHRTVIIDSAAVQGHSAVLDGHSVTGSAAAQRQLTGVHVDSAAVFRIGHIVLQMGVCGDDVMPRQRRIVGGVIVRRRGVDFTVPIGRNGRIVRLLICRHRIPRMLEVSVKGGIDNAHGHAGGVVGGRAGVIDSAAVAAGCRTLLELALSVGVALGGEGTVGHVDGAAISADMAVMEDHMGHGQSAIFHIQAAALIGVDALRNLVIVGYAVHFHIRQGEGAVGEVDCAALAVGFVGCEAVLEGGAADLHRCGRAICVNRTAMHLYPAVRKAAARDGDGAGGVAVISIHVNPAAAKIVTGGIRIAALKGAVRDRCGGGIREHPATASNAAMAILKIGTADTDDAAVRLEVYSAAEAMGRAIYK